MKLWIANLDPQTTDEELRAFVKKYSGLETTSITRVPGDGSRPGAMLEFAGSDLAVLDRAQRRMHGMYWKNRSLLVDVPSR
jgi:RNA recognition motif. (a.k.a. RRM, RBD, or RNP domain)